jgi:hypothetical protein
MRGEVLRREKSPSPARDVTVRAKKWDGCIGCELRLSMIAVARTGSRL